MQHLVAIPSYLQSFFLDFSSASSLLPFSEFLNSFCPFFKNISQEAIQFFSLMFNLPSTQLFLLLPIVGIYTKQL